MKKIVVYSHDTFGLGNIRRMLLITQHLLEEHSDLSILMITGSPVIHQFSLPRNRFDYIKLPCLSRDIEGQYDVKKLDIEFNQILSLRAQTIKVAIQKFNPDLVLVDKKPCGVARELMPALQFCEQQDKQTKWILLLRDILDHPSKTIKIWRKHAYNDVIMRFYQHIFVVGSETVFDICQQYELPEQLQDITEYCGYLHRTVHDQSGKTNSKPRLHQQQTVLVTPGGGEDGFNLIQHYLEGLSQNPLPDGYRSLIVTGPEMSTDHIDWIMRNAGSQKNVMVEVFTSRLLTYIEQAELVVSMAGYNTLCEILSLNKAAIVVPRVKPVQEQLIRAEQFAKHHLLHCIHPGQLNASRLLARVHHQIKQPNHQRLPADVIDFNGLPYISKRINTLLELTSRKTQSDSKQKHYDHEKKPASYHIRGENLSKNQRNIYLAGNSCPAT
ncbi:MAG: glycosyltransferase [Gammaproteobacteria bacterium]|nr:glycosyltransferase [Gammaproteobacteria bacterium]